MIRDGNGTRSFETLLRYCGAAMAEFWRALKTLKALQAEQAADAALAADPVEVHRKAPPTPPAARPPLVHRPRPSQPERCPAPPPERHLEYVLPDLHQPGRAPHETAARWTPNEPEAARDRSEMSHGRAGYRTSAA
jgi:hypothetical protein